VKEIFCMPNRFATLGYALLLTFVIPVPSEPQQGEKSPAKEKGPNIVAVPKPAMDLTTGTRKYKVTAVQPDGTYVGFYSIVIKDDGGVWTITYSIEAPDGPVTDVWTLEKRALILRRESFKHFAKPGRPEPFTINVDFSARAAGGKPYGTRVLRNR
jgi:hypothetical protein